MLFIRGATTSMIDHLIEFAHVAELPEKSYGADCRIYVPDHPTNRFKNLYVGYLLNNSPLP
jgi:hypothetical protein